MKALAKGILLLFLISILFLPIKIIAFGTQKSSNKEATESVSYKRPEYQPGEVLIEFKTSVSEKQKQVINKNAGAIKTLDKIGFRRKQSIHLVKLKQGVTVKAALKKLKAESLVKFASPNYIRKTSFIPNDPSFSEQWGLHNTGQETEWLAAGTPDADIDAPEVWDIEKGDTNQVTAAVIDSGIDLEHPDLLSKVAGGYNWAGISQRYTNTAWYLGKSNTNYRAQSIKGTGQPLTNIGLLVGKEGSPTANIVVSVRDSLDGQDLRTFTISASDVENQFAEIYKPLDSPITLTNGQTYYIVFRATVADDSNYYLIAGNSDLQDDYYGDVYAEGGQFWSDGSSWQSTDDNYDYWDWYFTTNANASSHDDNGHGTHVSGIVGASSDNNVGVAGVSYGAKILPLKVTDSSGEATSADLISAITYAADNGAKVINISLGGTGSSQLEQDAVNYAYGKGLTLFAASGNGAWDGNPVEYPAAYENVVSVGATTNNDTIAEFSSYNSYVDISAPGEGILSTMPTYPVALSDWGYFEDYDYMDGTSMASPMAAGVGSLVLSRNPNLSPEQVEQLIENNADDKGTTGKDEYFGYGRVNAFNAVQAAILNTEEPVVMNVTSSNSNGAYKAGDVLNVEVEFSESVFVTGTPKITMETGDIDQEAIYLSGSGSSIIVFQYSVQEGDNSADLSYGDNLILLSEGESIKDNDNNNANLKLPASGSPGSLNYNKNIAIDTIQPDTQIIAGPIEGSTIRTSLVSFYFKGDDSGGSGSYTYSHRLAGETDWTSYSTNKNASYSNLAVGQHTFEVKAKDAAGNENLTPASRNFTYTPQAPPFTASTFISAPERVDMVYDDNRRILYITSGGSVLRYNFNTKSFLSPFMIGGYLKGIDLSPDGNTLAVADNNYSVSDSWIHLVNLPTGQMEKISFTRSSPWQDSGTFAVAFGNDGNVLITSSFIGSGGNYPLRKYDLITGQKTELTKVTQDTIVSASADGSIIGFEESNLSSGPFGRYRVSDGDLLRKQGYRDGTSNYNYEIGVNRNGTQFAIVSSGGTYITNSNLNYYSIIGLSPGSQPIGVVYNPVKDIVYFPWSDTTKVYSYDSTTLNKIAEYDFKNSFNKPYDYGLFQEGRLKISRDGKILFSTVDGGIRAVDVETPSNPNISSAMHSLSKYSNDNTVDVMWSGASDVDGIDGYSFDWSQDLNYQPDEVKDVEENATSTTSPPLSNGRWYFVLRTRDNAGNWSKAISYGPVDIDKYRPRTYAPKKARVKRGRRVRLYYKVKDSYTGGYAYVKIVIKKGSRRVAEKKLGWQKIQSGSTVLLKYYKFLARLAIGKYKFYIYATDRAGNTQYNIARNYLVIY